MSKTFQTGLLPQKFLKAMRPEDRNPMGKAGVTTPEAKAKFDARTEKEVHKQICQWLDLHEIYYVHHRMDRKSGIASGAPDFHLQRANLVRPFCVGIEVKVNGNTLSEEQERVRQKMMDSDWEYYIVSSLQEVIELMK